MEQPRGSVSDDSYSNANVQIEESNNSVAGLLNGYEENDDNPEMNLWNPPSAVEENGQDEFSETNFNIVTEPSGTHISGEMVTDENQPITFTATQPVPSTPSNENLQSPEPQKQEQTLLPNDHKETLTDSRGNSYSPLDVVEGSRTELKRDTKHPFCEAIRFKSYSINSRGLFVIIKCTKHSFKYKGTEFSKTSRLAYHHDVDRIRNIFNLDLENDTNVIYGDEVYPDSEETDADGSSIRSLMDRVLKYSIKPSFVFVVVMSHGFDDGTFILSSEVDCADHTCTTDSHTKQGQCVARHTYEDVMRPIQEKKEFAGIPKVFIVQTCRGGSTGVAERNKAPRPAPQNLSDKYVPLQSDTLVLYASADKHISWVDNGSWLVKALEKTATDLQKTHFEQAKNIQKLKEKQKYPDIIREMPLESFMKGWMDDICLEVVEIVTDKLIVQTTGEEKDSRNRGKTVKSEAYDKQQPTVQSTLRYKLSFLQMMYSQNNYNL